MSNELAIKDNAQNALAFLKAGGGSWKFLKLCHKTSPQVDARKAQAGDFMITDQDVKNTIVFSKRGGQPPFNNLDEEGTYFECIVGPWRPHALHLANGTLVSESFDPTSKEFAQICANENKSDFQKGITYRYGTEILIYIPEHDVVGVLDYMTKTARRHSPAGSEGFTEPGNPRAILYTPAIIGSSLLKINNPTWIPSYCKPMDHKPEWYDKGVAKLMEVSQAFLNPGVTPGSRSVENEVTEINR